MRVADVVSNLRAGQATLQMLTLLHLTDYLSPPQADVQDGATYDVIIVGAGSAGCVLARRLTEDPRLKVLLVEAGGDPPLEVQLPGLEYYTANSRLDWNYSSTPDPFASPSHPGFIQHLTRGKTLGGSSSANYMAYVQGSPHDYNSWAEAANDPSWSYESIKKYFLKAEKFEDLDSLEDEQKCLHGTEGPIGVTIEPIEGVQKYLDAVKEVGYKIKSDISGYDCLGFVPGVFTISEGIRQSTFYSYLNPVKDRENLHVLKNALVTKVIFEGKRAVGVEILVNDKLIKVKAFKEVILSAGVFNTPQILMLSGVGPKSYLESFGIKVKADLPVGENFQDHAPVMVYFKLEKSDEPIKPSNPHKFPSKTIVGYTALDSEQDFADCQITIHVSDHDSPEPIEYCSFAVGFNDEICQVLADIEGRKIMSTLITDLHPKSRGRVLLRTLNPKDHVIVDARYFSNLEDLERTAGFIEDFVMRITNSSYFKKIGAELVDFNLSACSGLPGKYFWMCYARHLRSSQWHYCGTSALGSVVDGRLKVFGLEGLRVVDASAMPLITSGNTNIPVIILAEKAADIIKEDYGIDC